MVALAAGIGFGLLLSRSAPDRMERIVSVVEPFGTLFVNGIRMTVVPLVVSLVIVGIAGADSTRIARVGGRALLAALGFLCLSGIVGALIAPPVFARLSIDATAIATLRSRAAAALGSGSAAATGRGPS